MTGNPSGAESLGRPEPRAAYVHVPFCRHRCGYCNFTLVAGRDDLIKAYLRAIEQELSWLEQPREVDSLFLGGGTPSHLGPENLARLFRLLDRWFPRAAGCEVSVEANPSDCARSLIAVLREGGVTRVSLGVQSFDARKLKVLERDHGVAEVDAALRRLADFPSVSIDLIFGVPGETERAWRSDVEQAVARRVHHVSTYCLTVERGTSFWSRHRKGNLPLLGESVERWMYEHAIDRLSAAGYEHYEVSNFALPEHRCRHNETYWTGKGYFAAGPGAARFVDGRREVNHRSTTTYLKRVLAGRSPVAEREELPVEEAARERLVLGMRRMEGVGRDEFLRETSLDIDELVGEPLRRFTEAGLIQVQGDRIRLTREGLLVSDSLWSEFLG